MSDNNRTLTRLLDAPAAPRVSDGIDHPVTVRHTLDSRMDCFDFHVKQAQGASRAAAAARVEL